jgi:hypothetical protein
MSILAVLAPTELSDESDAPVIGAIGRMIAGARENGLTSSRCGQTPSNGPNKTCCWKPHANANATTARDDGAPNSQPTARCSCAWVRHVPASTILGTLPPPLRASASQQESLRHVMAARVQW